MADMVRTVARPATVGAAPVIQKMETVSVRLVKEGTDVKMVRKTNQILFF